MKLSQNHAIWVCADPKLVPYTAKLISFIDVFIPFSMIPAQELAEVIHESASLSAQGRGFPTPKRRVDRCDPSVTSSTQLLSRSSHLFNPLQCYSRYSAAHQAEVILIFASVSK
jgi:hypothetical protein